MSKINPLKISGIDVLRYEKVDPSKLKRTTTNNRVDIPEDSLISLTIESVKALGVTEPIIVNENYEIISGQIRNYSAQKANLKDVPVVVVRFQSPYHERVVSFLTDSTHTPLSDKDKYNFVRRAIEEDHKTVDEIALDTGLNPVTIRAWGDLGKAPQIVHVIEQKMNDDSTKKTIEEYYDSGQKKKGAIDKLLKSSQFSNDPKKALELIEASVTTKPDVNPLTQRSLIDMKKKADKGLTLDIKEEHRILQEETEMLHLRVPISVFNEMMSICQRLGKDPHKIIMNLVKDWVQNNK